MDEVKSGKSRPNGITATEATAMDQGVNHREPIGQRTPREHFEAVLAARGLKEIVPVDL